MHFGVWKRGLFERDLEGLSSLGNLSSSLSGCFKIAIDLFKLFLGDNLTRLWEDLSFLLFDMFFEGLIESDQVFLKLFLVLIDG